MRYLTQFERDAVTALAQMIGDDSLRAQCVADVAASSVEPINSDGSILEFHIPGYERLPEIGRSTYRGTDRFPVEGKVLDADGETMDVILFCDSNGRLLEFELIKYASGEVLGPDWSTFVVVPALLKPEG